MIAGIMDRGQLRMARWVDLDPPLVKIFLEQVKHAQHPKFLEHFRKPLREPEPGCIVGMASFRVHDGLYLEAPGILDDAGHADFHAGVIARVQSPVHPVPIDGRQGPVFLAA